MAELQELFPRLPSSILPSSIRTLYDRATVYYDYVHILESFDCTHLTLPAITNVGYTLNDNIQQRIVSGGEQQVFSFERLYIYSKWVYVTEWNAQHQRPNRAISDISPDGRRMTLLTCLAQFAFVLMFVSYFLFFTTFVCRDLADKKAIKRK